MDQSDVSEMDLYLNPCGTHFRSALTSRDINSRTLNTRYSLSFNFTHLIKIKNSILNIQIKNAKDPFFAKKTCKITITYSKGS